MAVGQRRRARIAALQALYEADTSHHTPQEVLERLVSQQRLPKDPAAFEQAYGANAAIVGQYRGSLNNGGEWVEIQDAAKQTIQRFRYKDDWYDATDGDGFSLTILDPTQTPADSLSDRDVWGPRTRIGGTPGHVVLR